MIDQYLLIATAQANLLREANQGKTHHEDIPHASPSSTEVKREIRLNEVPAESTIKKSKG